MAHQPDIAQVWELIEKIGICMLTTREGEALRARPMSAHAKPDENAIYFLADVRQHKEEIIRQTPSVGLAFADNGSYKYVSVTGHAEISNDRAKIKELWSTWAKAWWSGPDDPNIRLLRVDPVDAEYWDSPGKIISGIKMGVAALTGERPDLGRNRKVAM